MVTIATSEGKVIELEDMVLWRGIAIALGITITMRVIDALEELTEGDGLATVVTSEVLVGVSLGVVV